MDTGHTETAVAAREDLAVYREGRTRRVGRRGLEIVEKMAADGHTDCSIAKTLRMHRDSFRKVRARQPEVDECLARGRAVLEDELTSILLTKARKGDTIAAIYLTKARCGWREGELPPGHTIHAESVQINMPAQLSAEQFAELANSGGNGDDHRGD